MITDISTVNEIFNARKDFYKRSKTSDDAGHIFTSIINNENAYEVIDEKVLLYMAFQNFQSALFKLRTRNFSYAEYFISRAEKMMEKLESENAKTAIKGISLPLYSFKYYIKKDYEEATKALEASFPVFENLLDIGIEDAVWAKREQHLNLVRIYMSQGKYDEAFTFCKNVITNFLGTPDDTCPVMLSEREKQYVDSLSHFEKHDGMNGLIDSIILKINRLESKEQKKEIYKSFFRMLLEADGYNYLNACIENYLEDNKELTDHFITVCNQEYVLPRTIEGLLLKRMITYIDNHEVEKIITNYSTEALNISFG